MPIVGVAHSMTDCFDLAHAPDNGGLYVGSPENSWNRCYLSLIYFMNDVACVDTVPSSSTSHGGSTKAARASLAKSRCVQPES